MKRTMLTVFAVSFGASVLRADTLAESQARFGEITGDVGLLSQGASEWIVPHEGLPLEPGDQIKTGEDGVAEIVLSENALWVLQPNTEFSTEHMETHAGRFNLTSGALLGKVDSAHAGAPQHWEFNTPAAICGVRGTEFAIDVAPQSGTKLGVFEGEVEMSPAEGPQGIPEPIRVAAGQQSVAQRGKPPRRMDRFDPGMQAWRGRMAGVRPRLTRVQRTWSPFTPELRRDLRKRFVAPPPKPGRRALHPRRRRVQRTQGGGL